MCNEHPEKGLKVSAGTVDVTYGTSAQDTNDRISNILASASAAIDAVEKRTQE